MGEQLDLARKMVVATGIANEARALLALGLAELEESAADPKASVHWSWARRLREFLPDDGREAVDLHFDRSKPGTVGWVVDQAEKAARLSRTDPAKAHGLLARAEEVARKARPRAYRHRGWKALARAWAVVDRSRALRILAGLPAPRPADIVADINQVEPLAPEDWEALADDHVADLLDAAAQRDGAKLRPSHRLLSSAAREILADLLSPRITALVGIAEAVSAGEPGRVRAVLGPRVRALVDDAPPRFLALGFYVALWVFCKAYVSDPQADDTDLAYLRRALGQPDADFALAVWKGQRVGDVQQGIEALRAVNEQADDSLSAQRILCTVVLHNGLPQVALEMARHCKQPEDAVARIRRGWLQLFPRSARKHLTAEDFPGDELGQFLIAPNHEARAEMLLAKTKAGHVLWPPRAWQAPSHAILDTMLVHPDGPFLYHALYWSSAELALRSAELAHEQDTSCLVRAVRSFCHTYYDYRFVDQNLLGAAVAMARRDPTAATRLLMQAWGAWRPTTEEDIFDPVCLQLLIERSQHVLAAIPDVLIQDFLGWLDSTLSPGIERYVDARVMKLSIDQDSLLRIAMGAAAAVTPHCQGAADTIIRWALTAYANENTPRPLIEKAGGLYAARRGLRALADEAISDLVPPALVCDWEQGVVRRGLRMIAIELELASRTRPRSTRRKGPRLPGAPP